MKTKASLKFVRISPKKLNYFSALLKDKRISDALDLLKTEKSIKKRILIEKLLNSALANAKEKGAEEERLYIKEFIIGQGTTYKRRKIRSRGRADIIKKRTSHIKVVLAEKKKKRKKYIPKKSVRKRKIIKAQKPKRQGKIKKQGKTQN